MKVHEVKYIQNALSIDAPEKLLIRQQIYCQACLNLPELFLPRENVNPSGNWSF